ncbi:hypothetical protein PR048_017261 [Dryococelus australis]|uniref:Uncharacterized protein n=1 Tax=Dryococelus australis TaxID=614101 RepID=A0ABQ9H940_9NEOP|nr:hypothetical protein PR048_017261 [Dryococelus australis]
MQEHFLTEYHVTCSRVGGIERSKRASKNRTCSIRIDGSDLLTLEVEPPIGCRRNSMVYKYKRTTNQCDWSEETIKQAMEECESNTINSVATKYGILFVTLHQHCKSGSWKK